MFNSRSLLTTYLGLSLLIATSLVNASEKTFYMNLFAVEIVGDNSVAHNVASDHGFIIEKSPNRIGNVYVFVKEGTNRMSTSLARDPCTGLSSDPRVLSVEQQRVLHRVKRNLAMNDDQEIYDEGDDVRFSDPYFENQWYLTVQKRGAEVIAARKLSSTMSAAKAICDHLRDWWHGTKEGEWVSMGVPFDGSYGIEKGLIFNFPVTIKPGSNYTIVQGLKLNDFAKEKVAITLK